MKAQVSTMLAFVLLVLAASPAQAQTMTLGEVILFAPAGPTPPAGSTARLFQADRGNRKGQHLLVWTGSPKDAPAALGGASGQASEYHLLSPGTVRVLPDVQVLGIHYVKVKPERREGFERYVAETLNPAVANLRPDLGLLYYKAVKGPDAGNYVLIFALTKASRDRYWPGGADSDDLRAAFTPVQGLTKELNTYFVEGSALTDPKFAAAVFESREWSDFVLLPSR